MLQRSHAWISSLLVIGVVSLLLVERVDGKSDEWAQEDEVGHMCAPYLFTRSWISKNTEG
jgi:hypothetical protein